MFVTYPDVAYLSVCDCYPWGLGSRSLDGSAFRHVARWCDVTVSGVPRAVGPRRRFRSILTNFARNSPATSSNLEFTPLELQRFERYSKNDRGKLCATILAKPDDSVVAAPRPHRPPAPQDSTGTPPLPRTGLSTQPFRPSVHGGHLGHNENGGRYPPAPACRFSTPGRRRGLAA